ncbi:hypothetical protein, partial [Salmonella enterica]|uniref:hypothetical protein n=1 Tax=Salmonella enterica TaxID=28901 RepID=UPI001C9936B4
NSDRDSLSNRQTYRSKQLQLLASLFNRSSDENSFPEHISEKQDVVKPNVHRYSQSLHKYPPQGRYL